MNWTDPGLRLRALFGRAKAERELDDELRFHLEMEAGKLRAAGMTAEEAALQARREFGGLEQRREECRDARGTGVLESLGRDVQYGVRVLRKSPVFTCVAMASLAIGIGANTAVFSMVDTVLLRTLPVRHPEQLVVLGLSAKDSPPKLSSSYSNSSGGGRFGRWHTNVFSWPAFQSIRGSGVLAEAIGYSQMPRLSLTVNGESRVIGGLAASGNYFRALGVNMALGRPLQDDDDHEAGAPAAVISYGLWERAFGGDPAVLGKTIYLNRFPHTVVGVTPREFFGVSVLGFFRAEAVDVTLPIRARELMDHMPAGLPGWRSAGIFWVQMMGRVKPGTAGSLGPQLASLVAGALPEDDVEWMRTQDAQVDVMPGSHGLDSGRERFKSPFTVLAVAVLLTLLMACANLAGLLLARATTRSQEIATRLAVGAGRARLVRQLLTESALLATGGSAAGLALAWAGLGALRAATASGPFAIPVDVRLDARVLAFTAAVAVVTTMLFGLAPALRSTRVDLARGMKEQGAAGAGRSGFGAIRALVAVQIAVALLLVIGAALATRTLLNVRAIPLGFAARNLTVFNIDAGRSGYNEARRIALFSRLLEEFNRTAGVVLASASNEIPMSGFNSSSMVVPDGASQAVSTRLNGVSEGFFETLRIPLVAGRELTAHDAPGPRVAVINEAAARQFFGTPAAVGRRFRWSRAPLAGEVEVVGVVKDAKYDRLKGDAPATTYVPWRQTPWGLPQQLGFEILTAGDPAAALAGIRRAVRDADPMLPLIDLKTMERQIDEGIAQERLLASLVSLFGGITLVLACVGLYGMVSYTVAGRTREIGVRMALGADRVTVLAMVLRQVAATAGAGLLLGVPAAWAAGRFAESLLYGVKAHDAASFAMAAAIVMVVAALAAAGPARRAMRIDPLRALRYE